MTGALVHYQWCLDPHSPLPEVPMGWDKEQCAFGVPWVVGGGGCWHVPVLDHRDYFGSGVAQALLDGLWDIPCGGCRCILSVNPSAGYFPEYQFSAPAVEHLFQRQMQWHCKTARGWWENPPWFPNRTSCCTEKYFSLISTSDPQPLQFVGLTLPWFKICVCVNLSGAPMKPGVVVKLL